MFAYKPSLNHIRMKIILSFSLSLILLFPLVLTSQNVYEITCTGFSKNRSLNNLNFKLTMNNKVVAEENSKGGFFSFIILPDDGHVVLEISKKDYVPKIVHVRTSNYPFNNEYEIQEIDFDFEWLENSKDSVQVGELTWSDLTDAFNVIKVDSALHKVKSEYERSEKKLGRLYTRSIESGDELLAIAQPAYARKHYEVALLAKPGDNYASKKMAEIDRMKIEAKETREVKVFESDSKAVDAGLMDKINRGEINEIPGAAIDKSVIYSVQLGAFAKEINKEKFSDVPDFKTIPYDDFTRCFSGEFLDINEAIKRKNEMIWKGYKDAWIVKMRGHENIGF